MIGGNNIGRIGVLQSVEKHPGSYAFYRDIWKLGLDFCKLQLKLFEKKRKAQENKQGLLKYK